MFTSLCICIHTFDVKDLPDVEGDVKYNIKTLASEYGVEAVAKGASAVLGASYVGAILMPFILPGAFKAIPMIVSS